MSRAAGHVSHMSRATGHVSHMSRAAGHVSRVTCCRSRVTHVTCCRSRGTHVMCFRSRITHVTCRTRHVVLRVTDLSLMSSMFCVWNIAIKHDKTSLIRLSAGYYNKRHNITRDLHGGFLT